MIGCAAIDNVWPRNLHCCIWLRVWQAGLILELARIHNKKSAWKYTETKEQENKAKPAFIPQQKFYKWDKTERRTGKKERKWRPLGIRRIIRLRDG